MSHTSMSEEARQEAGIRETNIRLSIEIEDTEDILEDLENTLKP